MEARSTDYKSKIPTSKVWAPNLLWLHTTYDDILKKPNFMYETPLKGFTVSCPLLNAEFYLEVKKTSDTVLTIVCNRKFLSSRSEIDIGYFLRFYFTITGVLLETVSTDMFPNDDSVTVHYLTSMFSDSPYEQYYISTVKCVAVMIETSQLQGERLDAMDRGFHTFKKGFSKSQLKNMAYLLERPKLEGIFSGRETTEIFLTKLSYIERALPFSKQLAKYLQGRTQPKAAMVDLPLDEILCEIHCGEKRPITEEESISVYLNSLRIGMHFLYLIASDYISSHLNDDCVLDVLKAADSVNDRELFKAASDFFIENRGKILQSDKWNTLASVLPNSYARSIIHHMKIQKILECFQ